MAVNQWQEPVGRVGEEVAWHERGEPRRGVITAVHAGDPPWASVAALDGRPGVELPESRLSCRRTGYWPLRGS